MKFRNAFFSFFTALFLVLLMIDVAQSQNKNVSFSFSYPSPIGDTFYTNFDGIFNTQFGYSQLLFGNFYLKGELDLTKSKLDLRGPSGNNSTTDSIFLKFLISSEYPLLISNLFTIRPKLGFGYARLNFKNDDFNANETENGFTGRFSVQLEKNIFKNFSLGINGVYDFTQMVNQEGVPNTSYNRELHSVNVGIMGIYHF